MALIERLCIIGVGLIGGSIGMAARRRGVAGRVCGLVRRESAVGEALRAGAVDEATTKRKDALRGADLAVLATPMGDMAPIAAGIRSCLEPGCVVTDTGSTKAGLVETIESLLGGRAPFVGSHPIAGSERRGLAHAREDLFQGRACIVTASARTDTKALSLVREFWEALGARVSILSPERHDEIVARVSHLPHLAAAMLVNCVSSGPGGEDELVVQAGPGFRDATRIAAGPAEMWADICLRNRNNMLEALDAFEKEISAVREALEDRDSRLLKDILLRAKGIREKLG